MHIIWWRKIVHVALCGKWTQYIGLSQLTQISQILCSMCAEVRAFTKRIIMLHLMGRGWVNFVME